MQRLGGGATNASPCAAASLLETATEHRVRGDASGDDQRLAGELADGVPGAVEKRVGDRRLRRRGEIRDVLLARGAEPFDHVPHRGLEAREREVAAGAPLHRPGQVEPRRVAAARRALDRGPARIAEAEKLRHLVEGFPRRIVDGRAETDVVADAAHDEKLAMAAGDEEKQVGELDAVRQARGERVPLEVIDGDEGDVADEREGLRHRRADHDAADEPGPARHCDAVEIGKAESARLERALHDHVEHVEMRTRRDFRHDAAEGLMGFELRLDEVRENPRPALIGDDRRGGLVAARLDAEDDHSAGSLNCLPSCRPCR